LFVALLLFALAAWPLLLVDLPPFQDLPGHLATAHIIAHPDLYPEYGFNGFLKSNSLLTLWFHVVGGYGLFGAARLFTAIVLAMNALALPLFLLRFAGRRGLLVAAGFIWPLVHSYSVSMGFLNFAFAFALSLLLLTLIDRQRERPSLLGGLIIAAISGVVWYAHPFPLAVVVGLVALHAATRSTWRARLAAGLHLLSPLVPAGLLCLMAVQQHLVKDDRASALASAAFHFHNPWELASHLWHDVSGAFTRWGAMTIVPAVFLPYFAWKGRKDASFRREACPFFSTPVMVGLAVTYVALPTMLSNWWYLNSRLVPFLWVGLALRLPTKLPRPVAFALAACALSFSMVMGIDYVRLDRDRAAFTAGIDAVPERATLLPLMFKLGRTSDFTASLTHAWGYYTLAKNTSAPLAFAVERSYPISYREFPPHALIPPELDRLAERNATPAQVCKTLKRSPADAVCVTVWRELWNDFWRQAEPRFSHILAWAISPEARTMIPKRYHRVFAAAELEIYAREPLAPAPSPASSSAYTPPSVGVSTPP
jgi:hypothetical protein